MIYPI